MSLTELICHLRSSGRLGLIVLVVVPIASGLTTAFIVDDATDSSKYGFWIGSAVTAVMVSIVRRIQRGR